MRHAGFLLLGLLVTLPANAVVAVRQAPYDVPIEVVESAGFIGSVRCLRTSDDRLEFEVGKTYFSLSGPVERINLSAVHANMIDGFCLQGETYLLIAPREIVERVEETHQKAPASTAGAAVFVPLPTWVSYRVLARTVPFGMAVCPGETVPPVMAAHSDFGSRSVDRLGAVLASFLTSTGFEREKTRSLAHVHSTLGRWQCSGRTTEIDELSELSAGVYRASTDQEVASVILENLRLIEKAGLCEAFKLAPEHCVRDLPGSRGDEGLFGRYTCVEPHSYANLIPWDAANRTGQTPGDARAVTLLREALPALSPDADRARNLLRELVLAPVGSHNQEVIKSLAAGALMKLGVYDHAALAIDVLTMPAPLTSSRGFDLLVRQIQADVLVALDRKRTESTARLLRPEDVKRQHCDLGGVVAHEQACVNAYFQSFCADLGLGCVLAPP